MTYINQFTIKDSANLDAFSRVRTSTPTILFESTFEYDLAPLKYEQITSSGAEITTAGGTISTSPIIAEGFYVAASATAKSEFTREIQELYPLTLTAAGANHAFGTVSFYATGLGATSAVRLIAHWKEVR